MRTILLNQSKAGTMTDQSDEEAETKGFKEKDNQGGGEGGQNRHNGAQSSKDIRACVPREKVEE